MDVKQQNHAAWYAMRTLPYEDDSIKSDEIELIKVYIIAAFFNLGTLPIQIAAKMKAKPLATAASE